MQKKKQIDIYEKLKRSIAYLPKEKEQARQLRNQLSLLSVSKILTAERPLQVSLDNRIIALKKSNNLSLRKGISA